MNRKAYYRKISQLDLDSGRVNFDMTREMSYKNSHGRHGVQGINIRSANVTIETTTQKEVYTKSSSKTDRSERYQIPSRLSRHVLTGYENSKNSKIPSSGSETAKFLQKYLLKRDGPDSPVSSHSGQDQRIAEAGKEIPNSENNLYPDKSGFDGVGAWHVEQVRGLINVQRTPQL